MSHSSARNSQHATQGEDVRMEKDKDKRVKKMPVSLPLDCSIHC